jgi:hypothetical protein
MAITQWKARATNECLGTRSGTAAITAGESFTANFFGFAKMPT